MLTPTLRDQITAARTAAGFSDAHDYGHVVIAGRDAAAFLQRLTTNNVLSLTVGTGQHQALLDRQGHVRSLFYLLKVSEEHFHAFAPQVVATKSRDIFHSLIFADRVTVTSVTDAFRLFVLVGPHIENLIPSDKETLALRDTIYTVPAAYLVVPSAHSHLLHDQLRKQAIPITKPVLDILRLEVGIPEYGTDIDEHHILLEGKLTHAYARHKGCYPGQEVIERLHTYAHGMTPKVIASFPLAGEQVPAQGATVVTNSGQAAGVVTSCAYDPLVQQTWVMTSLIRKLAAGATHLEWIEKKLTLCS